MYHFLAIKNKKENSKYKQCIINEYMLIRVHNRCSISLPPSIILHILFVYKQGVRKQLHNMLISRILGKSLAYLNRGGSHICRTCMQDCKYIGILDKKNDKP